MKKVFAIMALAVLSVTAFADVIGKSDVVRVGTKKLILNDTNVLSLSSTSGVNTSKDDILYLTFSSQNAVTSLVGYDNGSSPVGYLPVKEDTSIKIGPYNGHYHVVCATCTDAAGVTLTVDIY